MSKVKARQITIPGLEVEFDNLEPGKYELEVVEIREQAIKGREDNNEAINVAFKHESGKWIWRLMPVFIPTNESDAAWFRMTTQSFLKALKVKSTTVDLDSLVGKTVQAKVSVRFNKGYGEQNVIDTFFVS